ncbi:MAG: alpha-ketoacid dehydrogenase subunit alpha/beta [Thermoanaerobaculia bacterium]
MNDSTFAGIAPAALRALLFRMLLIREAEERIADLVRDEKVDETGELVYDDAGNVVRIKKEVICPCHLYTGEEAVAVGVCAHLTDRDFVFSGHRCHGHYLAKGGDLDAMMAEIFGRETGCAKGRGGSMHLVHPEIGFPGTTPIVGSSIPHAVGAALAFKMRHEARVAISFFGDGATEEGRFHEALNMASYMKLPLVFVCENNLYSSHVRLEQRRAADLIHLHATPFDIPGIRADGNSIHEVYRTSKEAIDRARLGGGPTLIEYRTYRWRGHVGGNLDLEKGIRSRLEYEIWKDRDPVNSFERFLLDAEVLHASDLESLREEVRSRVREAIDNARKAPAPSPAELMRYTRTDESGPLPNVAPAARTDAKGRPLDHNLLGYGEAIREGTEQLMAADPRVFVMGQGVNSPWYVGASTTGLLKRFGAGRVLETPISEDTVTGATIGAAMAGMRPMVIHPRMDFALLGVEQLLSQAGNWHYMTGGSVTVPLVARLIVNRGGEQAAQHSQSLQALFAHAPGLTVVMPSTPYDAKGLLVASLLSDDPVVYIDDRWAYGDIEEVPRELYSLPLRKGFVRRVGSDVTVVATSYMNRRAIEAASLLEQEGISVEVIDPRTIKPLDAALILESVAKTRRLVVADGGWRAFGFTSEVAALVAESPIVRELKAPIARVALPDCPAPMSGVLEAAYYGDTKELADVIRRVCRE